MLGQFLLIGQQIGLVRAVLFRRRATGAGACDRADGDFVAKDPNKNFGAGADDLKATEVEIEHERRRVRPAQRAIERKRRQGEILRPALRRHDLKNITLADVILGLLDSVFVAFMGKVADRCASLFGIAQIAAGLRHCALQIADGVHDAFCGLSVGCTRGLAV